MSVVLQSDLRDGTVEVGDYRSTAEELLDLLRGPAWKADALCREYPKVAWFGQSDRSAKAAKAVCARCLVRSECLAYGLDDPNLDGIWGGLTRRERSQLRQSAGVIIGVDLTSGSPAVGIVKPEDCTRFHVEARGGDPEALGHLTA